MFIARFLLLMGMTMGACAYAGQGPSVVQGSAAAHPPARGLEVSDEGLELEDIPFGYRSGAARSIVIDIVNIPSQHKPLPLPSQEAVCEEKARKVTPQGSTHN